MCLDSFATGKIKNILHLTKHPNFKLIAGDIRSQDDCCKAVVGLNADKGSITSKTPKNTKEHKFVDYILHQVAFGSVPRSINDPKTLNNVNVCGFLKYADC